MKKIAITAALMLLALVPVMPQKADAQYYVRTPGYGYGWGAGDGYWHRRHAFYGVYNNNWGARPYWRDYDHDHDYYHRWHANRFYGHRWY